MLLAAHLSPGPLPQLGQLPLQQLAQLGPPLLLLHVRRDRCQPRGQVDNSSSCGSDGSLRLQRQQQ